MGASAAYGEDGHQDMRETGQGGYRGWGSTGNRANSNGLSAGSNSGLALSDYGNPGSPVNGVNQLSPVYPPIAEAQAGNGNFGRPEMGEPGTVAPLGAAPLTTSNARNVHRGPSNASSSYSMGKTSEVSGEPGRNDIGMANDGYHHAEGGQYPGPYGDQYFDNGQPGYGDASGRRNSRNDNLNQYPQGNSGIAMNF